MLSRFRTKLKYYRTSTRNMKRLKLTTYTFGGVTLLVGGYYSMDSQDRQIYKSMMSSSMRFARSLKVGLTISIDYWVSPLMGEPESALHQRAANRIVRGCLENGGLYIKLGQGLGAINHILPPEYITSLSTLQDKCLTRESDEVDRIFLQDFGKKPEEVFQKIEAQPVAAASLAQVYKGVTKEGKEVAIKVQYIDLQERFESDIKTVNFLLRVITLMHPKFNFHWALEELKETLAQELNFIVEGKNSERCADDLKKHSFVYVPKVDWELTTKRILTTEWIDGVKINDTKKMKELGFDIADVDKKFITAMGEQIFHTGFVHADPHPGNVFVRKDESGKAQIVLLDHGLYEQISEKTRVSLCNFWESMVLRNRKNLEYYAKELNVNNYVILAEILTQAPFDIPWKSKINLGNMNADEYMKKQAQDRFDELTSALRLMPSTLLLITRNLNTVRAITREHGNLVDRYKLFARIAVRGKYVTKSQPFHRKVRVTVERMKFETRLWMQSLGLWLFNVYLKLLNSIGYDITYYIE